MFVVVGDHCASSAGKRDVSVRKHHVPLILYAPEFVEPRVDQRLASQIDVAPTLLALLDFDYESRFFGHDLAQGGVERAFIGNYQSLGLYTDRALCLLRAGGRVEGFGVRADLELLDRPIDAELTESTVAWYQTAAESFHSHGLRRYEDARAARR